VTAVELEPVAGLEESPIHAQLQAQAEQDRADQSHIVAGVIRAEIEFFSPMLLDQDRVTLAIELLEGTGMVVVPRVDVQQLATDPTVE
jgi:hypothetical protein